MKNRETESVRMLENYVSFLHGEISLFSAFSALLEKIRFQVKNRKWQELENTIDTINKTGEDICTIENTRHVAFCILKEKYGLPPDAPLKLLSPFLGSEWGKRITTLSVKLKLEVIKVQSQAKGLNCYIRSVSGFLTRFFEEVYPHTKGKIYSRQGKTKDNTENPYIVNKQL